MGDRGPVCAVCDHPMRKQIETALLRGERAPKLSATFDVNRRAIRRHHRECMRSSIAAVAESLKVISGRSILDEMEKIRSGAEGDYRDLEELTTKARAAAAAQGVELETLDLVRLYRAKGSARRDWITTLGQYWEMVADVVAEEGADFTELPGFTAYQHAIMSPLDQFPEAKQAVHASLRALQHHKDDEK